MRSFILLFSILALFSCSRRATPSLPPLRSAMPAPWQLLQAEEQVVPFTGPHFDPVIITSKEDLVKWMLWVRIDSNYAELFDMNKVDVVASYRPENAGDKRWSLWRNEEAKTISVRKEDISRFVTEKTRSRAYIYLYRVPKDGELYKVTEY